MRCGVVLCGVVLCGVVCDDFYVLAGAVADRLVV